MGEANLFSVEIEALEQRKESILILHLKMKCQVFMTWPCTPSKFKRKFHTKPPLSTTCVELEYMPLANFNVRPLKCRPVFVIKLSCIHCIQYAVEISNSSQKKEGELVNAIRSVNTSLGNLLWWKDVWNQETKKTMAWEMRSK